MADERHVKGLAELQTFLDQLTPKMEANVMRGALRAGMQVVLPVARAKIRPRSGELAAGLALGTRVKGRTVSASIKAKGRAGWRAKFLEFGTRPHLIPKRGVAQTLLSFGGRFFRSVQHPGAQPRPFMRPALDQQANPAVVAAAEYIKARLAKKEGLDTSHVRIEGDE